MEVVVAASSPLRIATYNLRYDSKPDNISVAQSLSALPDPLQAPVYLGNSGEQPWSTRRLRVSERILGENVTILGVQEALVRQVNDLAELFGKDWAWVGVGRNDGKQEGEYSAIYYKKSSVSLRSVDHFWLSNTPFAPSKYPDAGSIRICTAARLTRLGNRPVNFTLLNTHLDDQSDAQRQLGASMLLARARYEAYTTGDPIFISGDFNSPPTGNDSGAYAIITGTRTPVALPADFAAKFAVPAGALPNFKLTDLRGAAPRARVGANFATFTGFNAPEDTSSWARIDFLFGGNNGGWTAHAYDVGSSLTDDGVLASDHRPIFADIAI